MQAGRCDLPFTMPSYYWRYVILPPVYLVPILMLAMYMKILNVARNQIRSIHVLVLQVRSLNYLLKMSSVSACTDSMTTSISN